AAVEAPASPASPGGVRASAYCPALPRASSVALPSSVSFRSDDLPAVPVAAVAVPENAAATTSAMNTLSTDFRTVNLLTRPATPGLPRQRLADRPVSDPGGCAVVGFIL